MVAIPNPLTRAVGDKFTAARWNADVVDAFNFLARDKPVCQVSQATTQSIASSNLAPISFDAETLDTDGQHSNVTNNTRVLIGQTLGWYRCSGIVAFGAATGARRGVEVALNGVSVNGSQVFVTGTTTAQFIGVPMPPFWVEATSASDYVELRGFQDTGGACPTAVSGGFRSSFTVEWVRKN